MKRTKQSNGKKVATLGVCTTDWQVRDDSSEVATWALGLDDRETDVQNPEEKRVGRVNGKCKGPEVGLNTGDSWEAEGLRVLRTGEEEEGRQGRKGEVVEADSATCLLFQAQGSATGQLWGKEVG